MKRIETTKEKWCEAEVSRAAGEIALMSPQPDAAKAEAYFERALVVARAQQAKSWELRAAMSMARGFGAIRASRTRPVISSLRYTAGSPKASTRST
jgi:predicted ATPase